MNFLLKKGKEEEEALLVGPAKVRLILLELVSDPYKLHQEKCCYFLKVYPILVLKLAKKEFVTNVLKDIAIFRHD